MSYSGPFINSIFKTDNIKNNSDIIQLSTNEDAQNTGIASHSSSSRNVKITYNGTPIDKYTHNTPMLTMSHLYNRTDAGILISITNKINLKGKIYGITRSGVGNLLTDETNLKNLFVSCPIGNLQVLCNSAVLLDATGVRAINFNTEPSSDNMLQSIGYSIDLEYHERQSDDVTSPLIVSCSDSWSIEPLEDYVYESFSLSPSTGTEPAPLVGTRTLSSNQLNIVSVPQFRVSHKVSAKGASYTSAANSCPTTGSGYFVPYDEARKWVSKRLDVPWLSSNSNGAYVGGYNTNSSAGSKLYLFNHVRATNFSMTEGSYDIVDTWIGMPTGINHIEDYSIEIGSDEKFVKTVKVQGTIKGLETVDQNRLNTNASLTPTDAGQIHLNNGFMDNKTDVSNIAYSSHNNLADKTTMKGYKYQNALLAWHSGIKPYLYTRASSALTRSISTTTAFKIDGTTGGEGIVDYYNRDAPKGSTANASERLLNPIPWTMTEGHDHRKGIITYNYEYNNKFALLDGVLSENITVTNTGPADVIAEVFVLGRSLGPVLQFLGSKTLTTKDLSIEISVMPPESVAAYNINNPACPLYTGGNLYKAIERLVDGIRPFRPYNTASTAGPVVYTAPAGAGATKNTTGKSYIDRDTRTWVPSEGRYTRNVSWKYQQCDTTKFYLDH
jgi:hypothetical protein